MLKLMMLTTFKLHVGLQLIAINSVLCCVFKLTLLTLVLKWEYYIFNQVHDAENEFLKY